MLSGPRPPRSAVGGGSGVPCRTARGNGVRIGLDGKVLTLRAGGIGRYAINLTRAMLAEAAARRPDLEFVIFTGPQTCPEIMAEFRGACDECFLGAKSSVIRSLALVPAALRRRRVDIFHGMDHVGIPFVGRTAKTVVTVHDVIVLILPETFTPRHRLVVRTALARVRRRADRVIVPSRAVKRDVVTRLGVPGGRVVVTPEGCDPRFRPVGSAEACAPPPPSTVSRRATCSPWGRWSRART